jgi:hypothetical protein
MGSGSSTDTTQAKALGKKDNEIVSLMMPIYYTAEEMLPEQRKLATDAWNLILNDTIPDIDARKKNDPEFTSVTFFYDSFYARLFDIHPMSRELFKSGMKSQGKFLVSMISLSLSELDNPDKFNTALVKLAEVHYHRGVKASECKWSTLVDLMYMYTAFACRSIMNSYTILIFFVYLLIRIDVCIYIYLI